MSGKPWHIHHGDVRRVVQALEPASFDAVLCDPPYGLRFMGRRWDYSVPSPMVWSGVERVLKPGAPGMIFGGSRTFHRLLVAVEDGGLEIRDVLLWLYGEGMPKSLDVAKAIDKKLGAARPVVGKRTLTGTAAMSTKEKGGTYTAGNDSRGRSKDVDVTAAGSDEAKRWEGYGTGLKPAYEPVALVRRLLEGTVADCALEYGVGGLHIDGSRIGIIEPRPLIESGTKTAPASDGWGGLGQGSRYAGTTTQGRWPGNVILVHTPECEVVEGKTTGCASHCPARMLDAQSGERPGGGAVRTPNQGFSSGRSMFGSGEHKGGVQAFGGYLDSGGASRFFKTCDADRTGLGEELFSRAKAILDEWLPSNVSSAERRSPLSKERVDFALSAVATKVSRGAIRFVDSIGLSTSVTLNVFETLCVNAIALILSSESECWPELLHAGHTRTRSLASSAGALARIGITTITISPETSGGSAVAATFARTSLSTAVGGADSPSRVWYTAKADGYQRNAGTVEEGEGGNDHPTVKPLDLIRYLAAMILPPKRDTPRRILVPFSGSGSEIIGCLQAGWDEVVGIEREAAYIEIAKARISQGGVLSGLMDKRLRRSSSIPTRRKRPAS